MKQHKSIVDKNGRVVGIQYIGDDFDDEPPMFDPFNADNTISLHSFNCHIGHPLGVKVIEYGVVASPNGYCIGHRDNPLQYFADSKEAIERLNDFNNLLLNNAPCSNVLEGRKFSIKCVSYAFVNSVSRVILQIECTEAIRDYLHKKWEFILTGSADIIFINDYICYKRATNLVIKGISVYDAMNNNTQGQTISLVQYV